MTVYAYFNEPLVDIIDHYDENAYLYFISYVVYPQE